MVKNITTIALSIVASLIVGCGGSDSSTTTTPELKTITGQFIDSAVEGLDYFCGDMSGATNLNGDFTCEVAETVTFKLGEYSIGSAVAIQSMTPITLHPTDTQAQENLLRLLQTLDINGNPSDGITLDSELIKLLKSDSLAINSKDFEGMSSVLGGKVLVSADDAIAHFEGKEEVLQKFTPEFIATLPTLYSVAYNEEELWSTSALTIKNGKFLKGNEGDFNDVTTEGDTLYTIMENGELEVDFRPDGPLLQFEIISITSEYIEVATDSGNYKEYWCFDKEVAENSLIAIKLNISVESGFTKEYLNGKTFYIKFPSEPISSELFTLDSTTSFLDENINPSVRRSDAYTGMDGMIRIVEGKIYEYTWSGNKKYNDGINIYTITAVDDEKITCTVAVPEAIENIYFYFNNPE